jgi:hypothetical protein
MPSFAIILPVADLVAIAVLVLGLYFPRHRRRDLMLAYLALNVGVLATAKALAATSVNMGLGIGLFGILAMIRLRSEELDQHEIAYYFSALAMGLIGGLGQAMGWTAVGMIAGIIVVIAVADSPQLVGGYRKQLVIVDQALADEEQLRAKLEGLFGVPMSSIQVRKIDYVQDLTWVDVRYVLRGRA